MPHLSVGRQQIARALAIFPVVRPFIPIARFPIGVVVRVELIAVVIEVVFGSHISPDYLLPDLPELRAAAA